MTFLERAITDGHAKLTGEDKQQAVPAPNGGQRDFSLSASVGERAGVRCRLSHFPKPEEYRFYKGDPNNDIQPVSKEALIGAIKNCHQTLWAGGKLSPPAAFGELCKIIFVKISDEQAKRKKGEPYEFQIKTHEPSRRLAERIKSLYETQKQKDPDVFKSQGANFQNENGSGKLDLRINGRCLFKTETLAGHGCHSVQRQQGHRIEISRNPSRKRHHWLAQASPIAGKARFCFSQTTARHICGRLFLARLPVALPDASRQPAILAKQDFKECETGLCHNLAIETRWLAGAPPLGAFAEGFGFSRAQNQFRIEHRKPMMQDRHAQL